MTANLEQLQFNWRELVERAQRGERVALTSKGEMVIGSRALHNCAELPLRKGRASSQTILDDLRSERG